VYTAILVLICAALFASIWLRKPVQGGRGARPGSLARVVDDGWVENVYRLQIMNATESVQRYRLNASGLPQMATDLRGDIIVEPAQARWVAIAVRVPPEAAATAGPGSHAMHFLIERVQETPGDSSATLQEKSTFMVPR
jgi:polyferredoxin